MFYSSNMDSEENNDKTELKYTRSKTKRFVLSHLHSVWDKNKTEFEKNKIALQCFVLFLEWH
jgi:hypothetical protein